MKRQLADMRRLTFQYTSNNIYKFLFYPGWDKKRTESTLIERMKFIFVERTIPNFLVAVNLGKHVIAALAVCIAVIAFP